MLLRFFVYGTLKPGQRYYERYCMDRVVDMQPAIARGQLFHLSLRGYPAMISGHQPVYGFVLGFSDPSILKELDALEDYQPGRPVEYNEYERRPIEVFNAAAQSFGIVWAYLMYPERVRSLGGVLLPDGWWGQERKSNHQD